MAEEPLPVPQRTGRTFGGTSRSFEEEPAKNHYCSASVVKSGGKRPVPSGPSRVTRADLQSGGGGPRR
ncbi:unnamed protein product [Merluccius merluccius]